MPHGTSQINTAEPNVLDFAWLRDGIHRPEVSKVIERASEGALLHIVNHGLDPSHFRTIRELTLEYMKTTSMEQKDKDSMDAVSGVFEGYKPRTEQHKKLGILPSVEEYNYHYGGSGAELDRRPQIFKTNDATLKVVMDFFHDELMPRLLCLLEEVSGLKKDELLKAHTSSSEVGHFLVYNSQWYEDDSRKLAAYGGHTDIGSLTFLSANPIGGLQVYGSEGWKDVAYIPNSIVCIIGEAMEYLTNERVNATLHRVVKPTPAQDGQPRPSFIYFIHPNHDIMYGSLERIRGIRRALTIQSQQSPGCPIGAAGLNRVISAISAKKEDIYHAAVDSEAWIKAKKGAMVSSPPGVCIDYDDLTISAPKAKVMPQ